MNESERDEREREKGRGREHIAMSSPTTIVCIMLSAMKRFQYVCVCYSLLITQTIYTLFAPLGLLM